MKPLTSLVPLTELPVGRVPPHLWQALVFTVLVLMLATNYSHP